jgi:hypothetical protein
MHTVMSTLIEAGNLCAQIAGDLAAWKTKRSGALYSSSIKALSLELAGYAKKLIAEEADYEFILNLPRYLKRLAVTARRAMDDPVRHAQRMDALLPYEKAIAAMKPASKVLKGECRGLLEEYKISLFAQQEVKAKPGTSEKRLREVFAKIG